ncbi:hypothetical protein TNCV_3566711 [Trichonephila clavipes]|nr:hypothetical protein TNCV_3566711 [Trichonephila clavipes]
MNNGKTLQRAKTKKVKRVCAVIAYPRIPTIPFKDLNISYEDISPGMKEDFLLSIMKILRKDMLKFYDKDDTVCLDFPHGMNTDGVDLGVDVCYKSVEAQRPSVKPWGPTGREDHISWLKAVEHPDVAEIKALVDRKQLRIGYFMDSSKSDVL